MAGAISLEQQKRSRIKQAGSVLRNHLCQEQLGRVSSALSRTDRLVIACPLTSRRRHHYSSPGDPGDVVVEALSASLHRRGQSVQEGAISAPRWHDVFSSQLQALKMASESSFHNLQESQSELTFLTGAALWFHRCPNGTACFFLIIQTWSLCMLNQWHCHIKAFNKYYRNDILQWVHIGFSQLCLPEGYIPFKIELKGPIMKYNFKGSVRLHCVYFKFILYILFIFVCTNEHWCYLWLCHKWEVCQHRLYGCSRSIWDIGVILFIFF